MQIRGNVKYFDEILLYIENEKSKDVKSLSNYTGLDEKEVKKALSIFKRMGLLKNSQDKTPLGSKLLNLEREIEE